MQPYYLVNPKITNRKKFKILLTEKYITSSCVICKNKVYKNGTPIFENKRTDLQSFLLSVYLHFDISYPKFYKMDNLCKLGWLASEILLKDELKLIDHKAEEIGIVLSNADSSLDTDLKYFETVKDIPSPGLFVYTLPNIMIGEICIRNQFKGPNAFFISEHFDAEFIEKYVSNLLDNNMVQHCICGWVELIREEYQAVLFLVEKEKRESFHLFTPQNMNKLIGD